MNRKDLTLLLMNIPSIGRERTRCILTSYNKDIDLISNINNLYPFLSVDPSMIDNALHKADILQKQSESHQISILGLNDYHFPNLLKSIGNCPPVIYAKGNLNVLNRPLNAALIGSRSSAEKVLKITELIAVILIEYGFTIISGLALGCDTRAHMTALRERAHTIAVLACGPDLIYPRENQFLYHQILTLKGAVLSEYPQGIFPQSFRFVERDRIQSGLSNITVLMESRLRGGAMYAAYAALKEKRPLLVYHPPEFYDGNRGNQYLISKRNVYPFSDLKEFQLLMKNIQKIIRDCNRETDQLLFPYA